MSTQDLSHVMGDMVELSSSSDPEPIDYEAPDAIPVTLQNELKHNTVLENGNNHAGQIVVDDIVEMDAEDDGDVFVVADIMGFRFKKKRLQFFCQWKGYPIADSTWEPAEEIVNICDAELLKKWKDKAALAAAKQSETPQGRRSFYMTSTIKQEGIPKNIPADSTNKDASPAAAHGRIKCPTKGCPVTFTQKRGARKHILLKRCRYVSNSEKKPNGPQSSPGPSSKTPQRPGSPTKKVVCLKESPSSKLPKIPSIFTQHRLKSNPRDGSESDVGDSKELPKPKTSPPKVAYASPSYVDEMETITLRRIKGSCPICDALPPDLKGHLLNTHIVPLDKVHRFI